MARILAGNDELPQGREALGELPFLHDRDGGIRTRDPLNPIQVRYRAALRPETDRES
jgi:hypothetical protein